MGPLLGWLIRDHRHHGNLHASLQNTAHMYRRRAMALAEWLSIYLPVLMTIIIGGTATVLYALAMLGPWFMLIYRMGVN